MTEEKNLDKIIKMIEKNLDKNILLKIYSVSFW